MRHRDLIARGWSDATPGAIEFRRPNATERWAGFQRSIAWYAPTLAFAAVFGAMAAFASKTLTVLAFGAMVGVVLLFAPLPVVLGSFIVITFLVVGPLTSIAHIKQAGWITYVIAFALLARVPMEWYHSSSLKDPPHSGVTNEAVSPVVWAVVAYFALMLLSLAANRPAPMQGLVGAKLYLFAWGIFFLLAVSSISAQNLERMWRGFLLIAVLQLPFTLYQRLVEVPRRTYAKFGTALDAIVGTFPGGEGGGANGALTVFLVFSMVLALSLWRNKLLSGVAVFIVLLASLASIALGEVKVIIVLFPLAFAIVNRREIIRRPLYFFTAGLVVVTVVGGLFWIFRGETKAPGRMNQTLAEHVEASFGYVLDPNNISYARAEVGRVAALNLWYRDGRRTPQTFLVGYGPAASHNSSQQSGAVASRYLPLTINSTTAAGMLWDIGVLGFASFLAILAIAFFQALRLFGSAHIPPFHRSVLEACAVLFALVGVTLPYGGDMLITPPLQVLFFIALAQVVYWYSRATARNSSTAL